jgi:hypothetical protein
MEPFPTMDRIFGGNYILEEMAEVAAYDSVIYKVWLA